MLIVFICPFFCYDVANINIRFAFLNLSWNRHHTTHKIRTHEHKIKSICIYAFFSSTIICDALYSFDTLRCWYTLIKMFRSQYVCGHLWHPQPIDGRIKSGFVDTHVISLFRRLTLYTSLQIVDHIKRKSYKYNELIVYKSQEKCKHSIYNSNKLIPTCATTHFAYKSFRNNKTTQTNISKMKDLANGNTLNENGGLIVNQKSEYHNGINNGDR